MPIHIRDAIEADKRAIKELTRVAPQMRASAGRAATKERSSHLWNNRTGRMERSTEALGPFSRGDSTLVVLQIGTPYAGYVDARGLVRIDEYAEQADIENQYFIDALKR